MLQYVCWRNCSTEADARPQLAPAPDSTKDAKGNCCLGRHFLINRMVLGGKGFKMFNIGFRVAARHPYFLASSPLKLFLVRANLPRPIPRSCKNAVRQTEVPVQLLGNMACFLQYFLSNQSFDEPLGSRGWLAVR